MTPFPRLAAIVNITPDSFSDGGRYYSPDHALEHAWQCIADGADIIDLGGESTRPGSVPVSTDEQLHRIMPVLEPLVARGIAVSVDTTCAEVARQAIVAGAIMINDVSGGMDSPQMIPLVANSQVAYCLMHRRGDSSTMQHHTQYGNVVAEVHQWLLAQAKVFLQCGGMPENLYLDPGIGFGKDVRGNIQLILHMHALRKAGFQTYLGASRKTFIGEVCGERDPQQRIAGSLVVALEAWRQNVDILRIHDVAATRQALLMAQALQQTMAEPRKDLSECLT
ncbi:dihydropteroate synthase [Chrysiogenes arsenatis]|uniref:dihydropteroate synthase n=1 Tax=Chrysiogenes arsenatis TaxID=309797 RepID=UPI00041C1542|nr:dihydropteroate synthase [Chrysiogenes arsenatis]